MLTQPPPSPESPIGTPYATENGIAPRTRFAFPRSRRPLIIAGAIALVIAIIVALRTLNSGGNAPRYITATVATADINATVEETGTVNPVNEVNVGTQVSGTISSLGVDFNSPVRKGQILATLDPTTFQAADEQAHGGYDAAQSDAAAAMSSAAQLQASMQGAIANARQANASVASAAANVSKAQAQLALSRSTVLRDDALLAQGFISKSQLDADVAAERSSDADVLAAKSALDAARAQVAASAAQIGVTANQHAAAVHQAEAAAAQAQSAQGQVRQADYNLARAVITSPIDGIVVSRNVSIGQTVAASFQTPTLFVIASSLRDMQIDTSVSEADVGQLRTGADAKITVPAFPNVTFHGTVLQVRVNPTTVQNVVTYDAIIAIHDDSARLKPGMTADVFISVGARRNVVAIPAAALLFRPSNQGSQNGNQPAGTSNAGIAAATPAPVAGAPGSTAAVWVLQGKRPVSVPIVIGLSDGQNYEVRSGKLRPGDRVIVGQLQTHTYANANPMGAGPGFGR